MSIWSAIGQSQPFLPVEIPLLFTKTCIRHGHFKRLFMIPSSPKHVCSLLPVSNTLSFSTDWLCISFTECWQYRNERRDG